MKSSSPLLLFSAYLLFVGTFPCSSASTQSDAYQNSPGPSEVGILRFDWTDKKRDRSVPVKIYFPKSGDAPFPIIIFSHGLGGSREGYEYLGREWASHGYVSVHLQHLGSDNAVWQGVPAADVMPRMRKAALDIANATNRPLDVRFAIDQIEQMNKTNPTLKNKLDLNHIGVAGHSFGAYTVLAIAGETFPLGNNRADPRVKAAIAMSSPSGSTRLRADAAFAQIKIPIFHMTGTKDSSPIGFDDASARRIPFDHIKTADQFLITFQDGDHMIFSGRGALPGGRNDEHFQTYIKMSSVAFWDARLKGDTKAKAWLTGDGFEKTLGAEGKFEKKLR